MNKNKEYAKLVILCSLLLSCTITFYTSSYSSKTNEYKLPRNKVCQKPTKLYRDAECNSLSDSELSSFQKSLGKALSSINNKKADMDQNEDKEQTCQRLQVQVQNCYTYVDEANRRINLSFNGCMKQIRNHNVCLSSFSSHLVKDKCQDEKKSMNMCAEQITSNTFDRNGLNKDGTTKNSNEVKKSDDR